MDNNQNTQQTPSQQSGSMSEKFRKRRAATSQPVTQQPIAEQPTQPTADTLQSSSPQKKSGNSDIIPAIVLGLSVVATIIIVIIIFSYKKAEAPDEVAYVDPYEEEVAAEAVEEAYSPATYLGVSQDQINVDATGGTFEIQVYTDGDWNISTGTYSWGHTTAYPDYVELKIDPNTGNDSRSDWFEITADDETRRINISQAGAAKSVEILSVWDSEDVYRDGEKGIDLHCKFKACNMKGEYLKVYFYFYKSDNSTPLLTPSGDRVYTFKIDDAPYQETTFNDLCKFMPYRGLYLSSNGGSVTLTYDVVIRDDDDNILARDENHRFELYY
jgi:hypothetical protein